MEEITYSKKQINPLIAKYNINPETNTTFRKIISMFADQTNYQIWAVKAVFENIAPLSTIEHIKSFADENQTLIARLSKQNLVSYKTAEDFALLLSEIAAATKIMLVKRCIEKFNTKQREMFKKHVFGGANDIAPIDAMKSSAFAANYEFFRKFDAMNESRRHKVIVLASAINDIKGLIKHVENAFVESYEWNKESLLSYIKTNPACEGVQKVFDKDNLVILEIPNFRASEAICGKGRTQWCLTREESYFKNYAGRESTRQYFFFDFSRDERHELAHVGFTVDSANGITYAHSTANNSMMGDGIRVGGVLVNIHSLLKNNEINSKIFIHLNGIKGFEWTMESVAKFIKNNKEIAACWGKDNRMVVKCLTKDAFKALCGNTLVNVDNLNFNDANAAVYVLLDLNAAKDDDYCMVTMQYAKDQYGSLSLGNMYDAYNHNITKQGYLDKIDVLTSYFLNREEIAPSILFHKLIDENNEKEALALLEKNPEGLDINYEFKQRTPIFTAIQNNMIGVFNAIVGNPSFDSSITDPFGEPLLCSLMYEYRQMLQQGTSASGTKNIKNMIDCILDSKSYDFNAININLDNAINIAAEREATNWIFDALVANPKVNINEVNDIDCAALGNAIRNKNLHAVELLGKRPDLVVTESDKKLATDNGIDLASYIKPEPFKEEAVAETASTPKVDANFIDEFTKAFAKAFASAKA